MSREEGGGKRNEFSCISSRIWEIHFVSAILGDIASPVGWLARFSNQIQRLVSWIYCIKYIALNYISIIVAGNVRVLLLNAMMVVVRR